MDKYQLPSSTKETQITDTVISTHYRPIFIHFCVSLMFLAASCPKYATMYATNAVRLVILLMTMMNYTESHHLEIGKQGIFS